MRLCVRKDPVSVAPVSACTSEAICAAKSRACWRKLLRDSRSEEHVPGRSKSTTIRILLERSGYIVHHFCMRSRLMRKSAWKSICCNIFSVTSKRWRGVTASTRWPRRKSIPS